MPLPFSRSGDFAVSGRQQRRIRAFQAAGLGKPVQHHETQHPRSGLLVPGHVTEQFRQRTGVVGHRQSQSLQNIAVASRGGLVKSAGEPGQFGGEHQSDGDRGTVPPAVAFAALDRVGEGVSVVENLPERRLLLVGGDHGGFDRDRAPDQLR